MLRTSCAKSQDLRPHSKAVARTVPQMQGALRFVGGPDAVSEKVIAPLAELGAYEWLWLQDKASFKKLAERFAERPGLLPSEFVDAADAIETGRKVVATFRERGVERFGVRVHRAGEYPATLRHARYPVELLYYAGEWELAERPAVSVVNHESL
jgi:DNA processing protein